jgi:hypothetical protein
MAGMETALDWAQCWFVIYVEDNHGRLDNAANRHSGFPSLPRKPIAEQPTKTGASLKEIMEDLRAWRRET